MKGKEGKEGKGKERKGRERKGKDSAALGTTIFNALASALASKKWRKVIFRNRNPAQLCGESHCFA